MNTGTLTLQNFDSLTNSGTIDLTSGDLRFENFTSATNTGAVTIPDGRMLTIDNGTFNHDAGMINGDGALELVSAATLNLATDYQTGGLDLSLTDSTLNVTGTLTNTMGDTLTLSGSSTTNADVVNAGMLEAEFINFGNGAATATFAGSFINESSGVFRLQAASTSGTTIATLTTDFQQGLTNAGRIELSEGPSGSAARGNAVLLISGGTLVNESTGEIVSLLGGGNGNLGLRTITADIDNQGTIDVGLDLRLNDVNATYANTGIINIAAGEQLLVTGGSFNQGPSGRLELQVASLTEFGSADFDTITLDGTLAMELFGGYSPMVSDTFDVLTYASRTGEFATIDGGTATYTVDYNANAGTTLRLEVAGVNATAAILTSHLVGGPRNTVESPTTKANSESREAAFSTFSRYSATRLEELLLLGRSQEWRNQEHRWIGRSMGQCAARRHDNSTVDDFWEALGAAHTEFEWLDEDV